MVIHSFANGGKPSQRGLSDSGLFPIPSVRTPAVDCLCVNSNYQELVPRFQKACPCNSSFLKSYLTGAVFLVCSRAGDKHHTMDCCTEGIAKLVCNKNPDAGGIKNQCLPGGKGDGTTGLSYHTQVIQTGQEPL